MNPQRPQFQDIVAPTPSPTSRPVISPQPQADPTITKIAVNFGRPANIPAPPPIAQPTMSPKPMIMPVEQAAPKSPTPPADTPVFGALQEKINAHPLFSGHAEAPVKKHSSFGKKLLWLLVITLLIAVTVYIILDSGIINTNINLPFHIFNRQVY